MQWLQVHNGGHCRDFKPSRMGRRMASLGTGNTEVQGFKIFMSLLQYL